MRKARDVTWQWIQYQGHVTVTHTQTLALAASSSTVTFFKQMGAGVPLSTSLYIPFIISVPLMLSTAGLYGLNTALHSFLIIQDNCSNISLPAWFHMAHHRTQSNKCACVRTRQFRETVRKFSESKTRLWMATDWKDKTVSCSTYRKITPAFTA